MKVKRTINYHEGYRIVGIDGSFDIIDPSDGELMDGEFETLSLAIMCIDSHYIPIQSEHKLN